MEFDITITVPGTSGTDTTVRVDAPDGATLRQLGEALVPYQPADGVLLFDGAELDDRLLSDLDVLQGVRIGVGSPVVEAAVPSRGARLHVEAGPATGSVVALAPGTTRLGRDPEAVQVAVLDGSVSRRHAELEGDADGGWSVRDLGSANGTVLGGTALDGKGGPLLPEQPVLLGSTAVTLVVAAATDLATSPDGDGTMGMNRPFRRQPTLEPTVITLPRAPVVDDHKAPFPWIGILLPLAMAGALVAITGRPQYALFALMSPIALLANTFSGRKAGKGKGAREAREHAAALTVVRQEEEDALRVEGLHRRAAAPDPGAITEICCVPGGRLWERRPDDRDFGQLRLGVADQPATSISYEGEGAKRWPKAVVRDAPVALDLAELGVVGLYGQAERTRAVARTLVLHLAALQGPEDLRITLIPRDIAEEDWGWVRWLPHLIDDDGTVTAGIDEDTRSRRLKELAKVIEARTAQLRSVGGARLNFPPIHVVVIEDVSAIRHQPAVARLLKEGRAVGVWTICLEANLSGVPQESRAAVCVDPDPETRLSHLELVEGQPIEAISLALTSAAMAERCARAIAPLEPAEAAASTSVGLDGTVRLLDLLRYRDADPEALRAVWDQTDRTTSFVIGETLDGPLTLDLNTDGPHGIVAGTTGAGKSQLLMSLVTSLAFANSPENLNFVLIDFKGGGAFESCRDLPHTRGLVTNLEGGGAQRAIRSLRAEANRRQALFAEFGGDINAYEGSRQRNPAGREKVPILVIVVDEFAQLAKFHEELLAEFIDVAQVGRSLGMCMILATQRPSGVIGPQITANTDLRIALRVKATDDSVALLDEPMAAWIPKRQRGRAFIQTADGIVEVQTAAVGIPRPDVRHRNVEVGVRARGWTDAVRPESEEAASTDKPDPTDTDLFAAVTLIRAACELGGYAIPPAPFRDELPKLLATEELGPPPAGVAGVPQLPLGREDVPGEQLQRPFLWHPTSGGLVVPGSPRSGRTTTLRTLAGQIGAHVPARDLHLYVIDLGGGLRVFEDLPQCGAVVGPSQLARARRLLDRLEGELAQRVRRFEELRVTDLVEQRSLPDVEPLPFISLFVDQWHVAATNPAWDGVVNAVKRLSAGGAAAGISVVIAGDARQCAGVVSGQELLVLRQDPRGEADRFELSARQLPETIEDGRAHRGRIGTAVQVALLDLDPSGAAQNDAIDRIVAAAIRRDADTPASSLPFGVGDLPVRLSFEEAEARPPARPAAPGQVLVGIGGDDLTRHTYDPEADRPVFAVYGAGGSGRTNVLIAMARSLAAAGRPVALVTPGRSALAAEPALVHLTGAEAQKPTAELLAPVVDAGGVVLVDDIDQVGDDAALAALLVGDRPGGLVLSAPLAWARQPRGLPAEVAKHRCGLVLTPETSGDGAQLGIKLSHASTFSEPKGRGYLALGGSAAPVLVQTPLVVAER